MPAYDGVATYIMANARNGTLYIGVTSDLFNRVLQHKRSEIAGFTSKYGCKRLVWYEQHEDIAAAIVKEKLLKHWLRRWKLKLIDDANSEWRELSDGWYAEDDGSIIAG